MNLIHWLKKIFSDVPELDHSGFEGGRVTGSLYALYTEQGKFLSLNPATDEFTEVDSIRELKIWDYQSYGDEQTWFMGNTSRPKVAFTIRRIPTQESKKLR